LKIELKTALRFCLSDLVRMKDVPAHCSSFAPNFFSLVSWLRFIDLAVLHERWQSAKLREETLIPLDQLLHREAEP
jgi:hypothetical protein